jgi:2-polyprenyl-6-methoxyphenol hydroxylase-like FAD-dependent oxidoreductase
MLGEATQRLLSDIFDRTGLFDGLPRIRKRIVAWGANSEPLALPHEAIVLSEQQLLDRIQPQFTGDHERRGRETAWTIFSSRPLPQPAHENHFGSRLAEASEVKLRNGCDAEACWIESLEKGWLFLLPGGGKAWLLSVGGSAESLLAESRLVARQIADSGKAGGSFPSHPRIADPFCAPGWLACGTAALGFDPLCGDGAGHAAREAILASAVIRAVIEGGDANALIAHYRARLLAGFKRHLEVCQEFYQSGRSGPWWDEQVDASRRGLQWCGSRLESVTNFQYRLNGFSLEPVGF